MSDVKIHQDIDRSIFPDILDEKFDKKRESYWVKKDLSGHTKEQYGKMY